MFAVLVGGGEPRKETVQIIFSRGRKEKR